MTAEKLEEWGKVYAWPISQAAAVSPPVPVQLAGAGRFDFKESWRRRASSPEDLAGPSPSIEVWLEGMDG